MLDKRVLVSSKHNELSKAGKTGRETRALTGLFKLGAPKSNPRLD